MESRYTKARDLEVGDIFRLHLYGEVVAIESVADGKRVRVKLALEDQGQRQNRGRLSPRDEHARRNPGLEFTDDGCTLEFLCPPGRKFALHNDWDGGDEDDDELVPVDPVAPA